MFTTQLDPARQAAESWGMWVPLPSLVVVLGAGMLLSGCILDTEPCGSEFEPVANHCVPRGAVDPYYEDQADVGGASDATVADTRVPWVQLPYQLVVIVDHTGPQQDNQTPGTDLDGVVIYDPSQSEAFPIGNAGAAFANGFRIESVFGEPERSDRPRDWISLGGQFGFVALRFEVPFFVGGSIEVVIGGDGFPKLFEVALCPEDTFTIPVRALDNPIDETDGCVSLGQFDGSVIIPFEALLDP